MDSLWARESYTITSNRREGTRYISACRMMGVQDPYPTRGPYALEDLWGMLIACVILLRSLDPGINTDNVQLEIIRKVRSHFSNYIHTIPNGIGATFMSE